MFLFNGLCKSLEKIAYAQKFSVQDNYASTKMQGLFRAIKAAPANASAAPTLTLHTTIRHRKHQLLFMLRVNFDAIAVADFASQNAARQQVLNRALERARPELRPPILLCIQSEAWVPKVNSQILEMVRQSGRPGSKGTTSPAKTVADCFKLRNRVGLDVALEALGDASRYQIVTHGELWHCAEINRVSNVRRPLNRGGSRALTTPKNGDASKHQGLPNASRPQD